MPVDLAVARDGRLYCVSRGQSSTETEAPREIDPSINQRELRLVDRVSIWSTDDEPVTKFGGKPGQGELVWPAGIAVDDERVYVTDEATHDVRVFDLEGQHLETWGRRGTGIGELQSPAGIAVERDGNVLVSDSANHRVQRFTSHGRPLDAWGGRGSSSGMFERPWGICVDVLGNVYVSDWGNDRVQKFSANGAHLATLGSSGTGDGELRRPAGLAVDEFGCVFVADWGNDRIEVFGPDGSHYARLLGDAAMSSWAIQFYFARPQRADERKAANSAELTRAEQGFRGPRCVKVDSDGRVLVADSERHRIQVYERLDFDLQPLDLSKGRRRVAGRASTTPKVPDDVSGAARVSPVIATFLRVCEEQVPNELGVQLTSDGMKPDNIAQSTAEDDSRRWLIIDWLVRTAAPVWLTVAGLREYAAKLRVLPELDEHQDVESVVDLVEEARDAAYAAAWSAGSDHRRQAAFQAARAQVWPAAVAAAAASEALALGARNIVGAAAWANAGDTEVADTISKLRGSAVAIRNRMIALDSEARP